MVEQLRRLLGRGDRWAWQVDGDELCSEAEEELADGEEDAAAGVGDEEEQQQQQPAAVLSSRGAGRRSGRQRGSRGQVLAGAVDYSSRPAQPWSRRGNPLPAGLQVAVRC